MVYILDGDLLKARCKSRRRPSFRLWFQLANLPKVSIRDLAHVGNLTSFASHIDSHYTTDPQHSKLALAMPTVTETNDIKFVVVLFHLTTILSSKSQM